MSPYRCLKASVREKTLHKEVSDLLISAGDPGGNLSIAGWSSELKSPAMMVGRLEVTYMYMLSKKEFLFWSPIAGA